MFQTFDDIADPALGAERARRLRAELKRQKLDGFLVPRSDEHQGEYVPPHAERLRWLTGFSGSAGLALVMLDKAAIFVDGRYTLQVRAQVDVSVFEPRHLVDEPVTGWIEHHLPASGRLGYDPWLHTVDQRARYEAAVKKAGGELVPVSRNLVDLAWEDQPEAPLAPVVPHPVELAGEASSSKLARIAASLGEADGFVLTMPDSIAWLFNIRGGDVSHVPLPLSFAIVNRDASAELFIDGRKLDAEVRAHLGNVVTVREPDEFAPALDALGVAGRAIQLDPASCAVFIHDRLAAAGARILKGTDPCELPKACKTDAEISGSRAAHVRDGLALTRFLAWLAAEGPKGAVDEIVAAKRLEAFRAETGKLKDLSFDTISGAGDNGAIVHYRVTSATNRLLRPGELFLVDSGAQYVDGTTDVTRTVAIGEPGAEEKDRFTRVLKGHVAIATARFPEGTTGAQIDALARMALWQAGLDFDHGTGHGVGSYLSVHEGPQRISKFGAAAFRPGMIVSNEPGFYKTGAYGIRIENLLVVTGPAAIEGGEREMLGFETLTLAPIDLALVDPSLLNADERAWLNGYHARVRETHAPHLELPLRAWLAHATRAI